ncbi:hypothetical protein [Bacillus multifaciens]|uniref:hypothetical protein n=1 Tax=Bacillus multifaciens TaxID=3068506 RepID=UPI002741FF9C|nr:hypothetical protein [Bacillus sp. WLY-B-L8]MDP7978945.1 hypothetical protein [Bacillus sp. WLY-B-L8]
MFGKKSTMCTSCGKEIAVHERSWIYMQYPPSGMTNMQKHIELSGEVYCTSCVGKLEKQKNN